MALMMVVITGFMALDIDAGLGYDRSRQDQDIADAAALAATYYIAQNPTGTLAAAYTAAQQMATLDGCSSPCQIPYIGGHSYLELWTAASTAGYNTTYTSASSPTPNYPSFYVNSSGACATATNPNGPFTTTGVTCPSLSQVSDVGLPVKDTGNVYFGAADGAKSYSIAASAVAQVSGTGSGSSGGIGFPCEVCILDNLTTNDGGTLAANGGAIEIGGYANFSAGSNSIIETTNGYNIDIFGSDTIPGSSPSAVFYTNGSATVEATGGGSVYMHGNVDMASSNTVTGTAVNITGTVTAGGVVTNSSTSNAGNNCSSNYNHDYTIPCPWTTTAPSPSTLADPLNARKYSLPASCTGSYCSTADTPASGATLNAGVYYGINISHGGTVNFDPGVYILDGTGINVSGSAPTLTCSTCSGSSGVTLYFTCNSGSGGSPAYAPTNCTATTGKSGAGFSTNTGMTVSLKAPTTGPEGNLLFWFDPLDSCTTSDANSACMDMHGGSWDFSASKGALYMADSTLYKNNTISLVGPLIVDNVVNDGSTLALGTLTGPTLIGGSPAPGGLVR
jgi:hypothetical protein